jgi:hypothetical protein
MRWRALFPLDIRITRDDQSRSRLQNMRLSRVHLARFRLRRLTLDGAQFLQCLFNMEKRPRRSRGVDHLAEFGLGEKEVDFDQFRKLFVGHVRLLLPISGFTLEREWRRATFRQLTY